MSTSVRSLDRLQAFVEKHQAEDVEEATQLFSSTPIIREIGRALSCFAHVLFALSACGTPGDPDNLVDEAVNLTNTLAVTLYLIGYRAGKAEGDDSV